MMKLLVLCVCVSYILGDSEPMRAVMLFDQADTDKDGFIVRSDLDRIFLLFDQNHDGKVTRAEFKHEWTDVLMLGAPSEAEMLFARADHNHDSFINADDLPFIFNYFDGMNHDGQVDINEFLTQWGDLTLGPVNHQVIDVPLITDVPDTA